MGGPDLAAYCAVINRFGLKSHATDVADRKEGRNQPNAARAFWGGLARPVLSDVARRA